MRKEFNEALGVPENQIDTAIKIYERILKIIPKDYDVSDLKDFKKKFRGDFKVGDVTFSTVDFEIDIEGVTDELDLIGMATSEKSRLSNDFKVEKLTTATFNISFRYAVTSDTTGEELVQDMITNKLEYIGSISHELKHFYDNRKIGPTPLTKRVKYETASSEGFANITPVNEFIHYIYYANAIESLVRPSEFAALVKAGEIDKQQFYKFLTSTRTYERLNRMRSYTYETLRNDLIKEADRIKRLFERLDFPYEGKSDEELADDIIRLVAVNFGNWMGDRMRKRLTTNFMEAIAGFTGDKEKYFDKFINNVQKYQNNPKKFIEYETKNMNRVGDYMIRKIAKLYDTAADVKNESIINWEVWKLINENNRK